MSVCDDKAVVHSMKTDDVFSYMVCLNSNSCTRQVSGVKAGRFRIRAKIQSSADGDGTGIPVTEFTKGCTSALVFGGGSVTPLRCGKTPSHFPVALRIDDSLGVICTIKKLKVVNAFQDKPSIR